MNEHENNQKDELPSELSYDYIKSNHYRVIYASGATGGINLKGMIQMSIFNERGPIPQTEVFEVVNGKMGPPIEEKRKVREGFVREVEATLLFDLSAAKAFREWLDKVIAAKEARPAHAKE